MIYVIFLGCLIPSMESRDAAWHAVLHVEDKLVACVMIVVEQSDGGPNVFDVLLDSRLHWLRSRLFQLIGGTDADEVKTHLVGVHGFEMRSKHLEADEMGQNQNKDMGTKARSALFQVQAFILGKGIFHTRLQVKVSMAGKSRQDEPVGEEAFLAVALQCDVIRIIIVVHWCSDSIGVGAGAGVGVGFGVCVHTLWVTHAWEGTEIR